MSKQRKEPMTAADSLSIIRNHSDLRRKTHECGENQLEIQFPLPVITQKL